MITPEFIGQIYRNTLNGDVWRANSLTPGDWTKIAGTAVAGSNVDGVGNPTGVVTPLYVGQYYRDTATGSIWKSTGATSADWTLVVQDMQVNWTPITTKLGERAGFFIFSNIPDVSSLTFNAASMMEGVSIYGCDSLTSVAFPDLIQNDPTGTYTDYIDVDTSANLTTVSAPSLTTVGDALDLYANPELISVDLSSLTTVLGTFNVYNNAKLASINLPLLVTVGNTFNVSFSPLLTSINIPSYLPTNTKQLSCNNCAFPLSQIDGILARCVANAAYVSGNVFIDGGTNAAPTTGPGSSHDILVARGVTITHN